MDLTISERLAVVETKVDALKEGWSMTDGRVQVACDYILAEKARKSMATKGLVALGAVISAGATLYRLFTALPHK